MKVYYNEIDDYCIEALKQLMMDGVIPKGDIDERSIEDVLPSDLDGYDQCHFFAGIGVWAYVTKDHGKLWTGSCPCQPFSQAGKRKGFADKRHLWPAFHWLIEQCRPHLVLGEQVGSKAALPWIDLVFDDLEGAGYSVWAKNFPAASVGAAHIRQRIYWCGVDNSFFQGLERHRANREEKRWKNQDRSIAEAGVLVGGVSNTDIERRESWRWDNASMGYGKTSSTSGFWSDIEWLPYKDGKWRPTKPGLCPLAHGFTGRIPLLSALGNTIVAQQAKIFTETIFETRS